MMIEDFVTKILYLMIYVPYLREVKAKVQWFMSFLPKSYKDKIEVLNPKTMDELIRNSNLCYTKFQQRSENTKTW